LDAFDAERAVAEIRRGELVHARTVREGAVR
jgi:hypothetical protein